MAFNILIIYIYTYIYILYIYSHYEWNLRLINFWWPSLLQFWRSQPTYHVKTLHFTPCVHSISKSISPMAFKFGYMMSMDRISDSPTFGDDGSIFKLTEGLDVRKYCILHHVSTIFRIEFHQWLSNIWWPWTESRLLAQSSKSQLDFLVSAIFPKYFTKGFQIWIYMVNVGCINMNVTRWWGDSGETYV